MSDVREHRYVSEDGRLSVKLNSVALAVMLSSSAEAGRRETGGILIGRYCDDGTTALVKEATPKPKGSRFGGSWFQRGTDGLSLLLADRWKRGDYYLGEWHFHPDASSEPSGRDLATMREIARNVRYHCKEPILLIVGGRPPERWNLTVTVTLAHEAARRLVKTADPD